MSQPWLRQVGGLLPQPQFGSLRSRVVAAFCVTILLTLVFASAAVVWVIQSYRSQLAVDHLSELSLAASLSGRQLERQDATPDTIAGAISLVVRDSASSVLVVDNQGRVVAERGAGNFQSERVFLGKRLEVPSTNTQQLQSNHRPGLRAMTLAWSTANLTGGRPFIFVTANFLSPGFLNQMPDGQAERFVSRPSIYRVVLAIPQHDLASAWREVAPGLGVAALLALAASIAFAVLLARSITQPLGQITAAARRIAKGELRQSIPVRGSDEVAQLAQAFNIMSREVETSHRSLREFLANASHELRTPLTSIQGFSQALLDDALPGREGAMEAGKIINEEAERMRHLVEDLLYLSRMESRNVEAPRGPVNVAALLREDLRRVEAAAAQRELELVVNLPESLMAIGDGDELDHLFSNLLDNARKYTPRGGRITVSGHAEGQNISLSVRNTGSFITPEDIPHLFERFYRVDKSRARDVDGSGLGLAIAHEVAERHGAQIVVASDKRSGTVFTVRLLQAPPAATKVRSDRLAGVIWSESRRTAAVGQGQNPSEEPTAPAALPV